MLSSKQFTKQQIYNTKKKKMKQEICYTQINFNKYISFSVNQSVAEKFFCNFSA